MTYFNAPVVWLVLPSIKHAILQYLKIVKLVK